MSLMPVENGQIATIVTSLEMSERPKPAPIKTSPLRLVRWKSPDPAKYRTLFRRVGEPWLWFSRLVMDEDALDATINAPTTEIYAVCDPQGIEVGLIELDFAILGECKIAFFGLIPQLSGQGLGQWMMAQTLMLGWRKDVNRLYVETCTLDHPKALPFYIRSGFNPIKRAVENFPDPRLVGLLDMESAPHIPIIR